MVKFEEFNKWMEEYKTISDTEKKINDALQVFSPDFGGFYLEDVHGLILDLLKRIMKDENDWIGYYMFELNWGKDWTENSITDENGQSIKLQTVEDLYNLLESEYENNKV